MLRDLVVGAMFVLIPLGLQAEDWPMWRGPHGNGHSKGDRFPVQWSALENVQWRVKLPGPGNSTPIIVGQRLFVSCASKGGHRRSLLCLDRNDGSTIWEQPIDFSPAESSVEQNPFCSSSPVSDGERVVVWHGSAGLFAYDVDGAPLWDRNLGTFPHPCGTGSSPVIHKNLVILNCGPGTNAFLLAVDKRTGQDVWRRKLPGMACDDPGESFGSWSSPVITQQGQQDLLVVALPDRLYAFEPLTGREIWSTAGLGKHIYATPLCSPQAVVAMSGQHGPALAVNPKGQGDITETHLLWSHNQKTPQRFGSGVIVEDFIFILNEPGFAWCIDLATGQVVWKQLIGEEPSWGSMCYAGGLLYVNDVAGATYVMQPDPTECNVLAKNELGEPMRASLAFSQGQIFARTYLHLYCIEAAAKSPEKQ